MSSSSSSSSGGGVCICNSGQGYSGDDCSSCLSGFVAVGSVCVRLQAATSSSGTGSTPTPIASSSSSQSWLLDDSTVVISGVAGIAAVSASLSHSLRTSSNSTLLGGSDNGRAPLSPAGRTPSSARLPVDAVSEVSRSTVTSLPFVAHTSGKATNCLAVRPLSPQRLVATNTDSLSASGPSVEPLAKAPVPSGVGVNGQRGNTPSPDPYRALHLSANP